MPDRRKLIAYALPMALFLGFLALDSALKKFPGGGFWLRAPEYWIYPTQTILCGFVLFWFRDVYKFRRLQRPFFTLAVAVFVFVLWISPQQFLGFGVRNIGFDPSVFADRPGLYWATVVFRFLRLALVVPFVEEIFWRGFLLRYLIDERFDRVPLGAFSWLSFSVVTLAFTFSHSSADWVAAFITGMLYNWVMYRTKSLSSCVLAHAITNFLLGLWIMQTRQWGFW